VILQSTGPKLKQTTPKEYKSQAGLYLPVLKYSGHVYPRVPLPPVVLTLSLTNLAKPQSISCAVKSPLITMLADLMSQWEQLPMRLSLLPACRNRIAVSKSLATCTRRWNEPSPQVIFQERIQRPLSGSSRVGVLQ
jgi:hypothetical protein